MMSDTPPTAWRGAANEGETLMMRSRGGILVTVVFVVVWTRVAAGQGLYWESTITGVGNEARTTQTYTMPKMIKIVTSDGKTVILRTDQDKFFTIDTKKGTYREITFADMEAKMDAARAEMEKRMKDMPPEQRAMMEKMLPESPGAEGAKPSALAVKNTGETKTISGHVCTKYVASDEGKPILTVWTTKDVKGFEPLRDDWLAYQKRLEKTNRSFGNATAAAYEKIEGFPMETEMHDIRTVVTKVEPRTTAASEFEVPAGYRKEGVPFPKGPHL